MLLPNYTQWTFDLHFILDKNSLAVTQVDQSLPAMLKVKTETRLQLFVERLGKSQKLKRKKLFIIKCDLIKS